MKRSIFSFALVLASLLTYAQETPKVKKVQKKPTTTVSKQKVVNAEDPICQMSTADHLKETTVYSGKTYGFCSKYCKDEFVKNPKKYIKK